MRQECVRSRGRRSALAVRDHLVDHLRNRLVDDLLLLLDIGGDIGGVVGAVPLELVAVAAEIVDRHGVEDPVVDDDV